MPKLIMHLKYFGFSFIILLTASNCNARAVKDEISGSITTEENYSCYINVKLYGAKGDGVTDDAMAIQKALNQGAGRVVFFPKGNYRISKPLKLSSGTEILGEGDVGAIAGSSILPLNDDRTFAIFTSNTNNLEDVIFRNIRTLRAKYSLWIDGGKGFLTKIKWYNCVFQEHDICINVVGSKVNGMYANAFRDCYFKSSRIGIVCEGPYNINIIQGCGFENMGDGYIKLNSIESPNLANSFIENRCESVVNFNGIAIDLNKNVLGFYINRNFFENSFKTLLKSNGARNVDFSNNTYTNSDTNKFGLILINGGDVIIRNNISMTGLVLEITNKGYCSELASNNFLNFSNTVKSEDLGTVNNIYNKKYNK